MASSSQNSLPDYDHFRGALVGLAIGDAVGTSLEFRPPGTFDPISDMVGGGPFDLRPGEWTDDTSMAMCLAESLLARQGFDEFDQIDRYRQWYRAGYWSCRDRCFDIGNTVREAIERFEENRIPWAGSPDPRSAGNGSIMRLAPVPLYFCSHPAEAIGRSAESSRTTHGAPACVDACRLLAALILSALSAATKDAAFRWADVLLDDAQDGPLVQEIEQIRLGSYREKEPPEIRGTGYVVESLEAALWAFHKTDSFQAAILAAANLGNDADTTAAICGQIAGAYYGFSGIPEEWTERLAWRKQINRLAEKLFHCAHRSPGSQAEQMHELKTAEQGISGRNL